MNIELRTVEWTEAKLKKFVHEVVHQPLLWDDTNAAAPRESLLTLLLTPALWLEVFDSEDDEDRALGMIWFRIDSARRKAYSHILLWDKLALGMPTIGRAAMRRLVETVPDLEKLEAVIPMTNPRALLYAERLGFKREGLQRAATRREGKPVDIMLYGLTREEVDRIVNGDAS